MAKVFLWLISLLWVVSISTISICSRLDLANETVEGIAFLSALVGFQYCLVAYVLIKFLRLLNMVDDRRKE